MPGSFSTVLAHMEPPSSRKQAKRVRLGPKRTLRGCRSGPNYTRLARLGCIHGQWPLVTTHFDLVSGPFHSPIFIGLHSVSTSANMYHLNLRAGELPRSASSHFFLWLWPLVYCSSPVTNCLGRWLPKKDPIDSTIRIYDDYINSYDNYINSYDNDIKIFDNDMVTVKQ